MGIEARCQIDRTICRDLNRKEHATNLEGGVEEIPKCLRPSDCEVNTKTLVLTQQPASSG